MTLAPEASDQPSNDLPLKGIRILDLSRALAGPFCTSLLADLGADVVKVEGLDGEVCRQWGPWEGGESLYFLAANRNKRSIAIDMWSDEGKALLRRMAADFDVVVENFRPGVIDALGIGQAWAAENHPNLIVTSINGFGHVGPRANEACFDQIALGMGGFMSITGSQESGPLRVGVALADLLAGMFTAVGICASLVSRAPARTVQTSLLESVIGVLTFQGQRFLSRGEIPERTGNDHPVTVPYGVFETADFPINLAAATQPQWVSLCGVLGLEPLTQDERFATGQLRNANKAALIPDIQARFKTRTAAEWLAVLAEAHVPSGPVNDMEHVFAEPQVQALGMVVEGAHASLGSVTMTRGPLWIDGSPTPVWSAAPVIGQHTSEVLRECGLTEGAIEALLADKVVAQWAHE